MNGSLATEMVDLGSNPILVMSNTWILVLPASLLSAWHYASSKESVGRGASPVSSKQMDRW